MDNGKMDVMGINIDISQVLGEKIVDQYIAQLDEDSMKELIDYISSDLFTTKKYYDYEVSQYVTKKVIKERVKDSWGNYKDKETPVGELIKRKFNQRIDEELMQKIEEIVASTDYQNKVEEIANELIDYCINGYKEDMKARVRERLIGNVMDTVPTYDSISLTNLISNIVNQKIHY